MSHRATQLSAIAVCLLAVTWSTPAAAQQQPESPELDCGAAVLIDPETRQIIFEKNADERLYPASLTKMMTALLVAEAGDLQRTVMISENAAAIGETTMNLTAGEELTLEHILMGALLSSANDGAVACAEAVSGSVDEFVERMNERAVELGMTNTNFANPHGLHDDDHFSSARDLAILALQVMGRAELRPIVRRQDAIVPWPGRSYDRKLINRNRLLEYWSAADGIKTGYTRQAGNCLAASAYVDGWRLICVVMGCERKPWDEAQALLSWGFDNFFKVALVSKDLTKATVEVDGGVADVVHARAAEDVIAIVPRGPLAEPALRSDVVKAPVAAGDTVGSLVVTMPDGETRSVDLIAVEDVARSPWAQVLADHRYFVVLALLMAVAVGVLVHGAASEALGSRRTG
ncbi:MAG: D-alanyl-D-alanine carboxypeptidase family protein [Armatimonadota bacterium]